jgi:hypothetical protein
MKKPDALAPAWPKTPQKTGKDGRPIQKLKPFEN